MSERSFSSASFYAFLREGKLMGSRCKSTGQLYLPPRALCPTTYTNDMEWAELSGRGKLVAFTTIHFGLARMTGYDRDHPYCTGIVELEEGVRISAFIQGVDGHHPETISVGTAVIVDFAAGNTENEIRLVFRPA
jgi:hypothetical protein